MGQEDPRIDLVSSERGGVPGVGAGNRLAGGCGSEDLDLGAADDIIGEGGCALDAVASVRIRRGRDRHGHPTYSAVDDNACYAISCGI